MPTCSIGSRTVDPGPAADNANNRLALGPSVLAVAIPCFYPLLLITVRVAAVEIEALHIIIIVLVLLQELL
jgi:hypothetical protein